MISVQKTRILRGTANIALKHLMSCAGTVGVHIMAKLTRPEFKFSPGGIASLCPDLPVPMRLALLNQLDLAWNETEPFEVEVEIPLKEHPHVHILNIEVDTVTQQVTIERRVGSEYFSSCPECRMAVC